MSLWVKSLQTGKMMIYCSIKSNRWKIIGPPECDSKMAQLPISIHFHYGLVLPGKLTCPLKINGLEDVFSIEKKTCLGNKIVCFRGCKLNTSSMGPTTGYPLNWAWCHWHWPKKRSYEQPKDWLIYVRDQLCDYMTCSSLYYRYVSDS